jgi:hypothetical protein
MAWRGQRVFVRKKGLWYQKKVVFQKVMVKDLLMGWDFGGLRTSGGQEEPNAVVK